MGKWLNEPFLQLDFDNLWEGFDDNKRLLVCLSQRDISVLVSCLRYVTWPSRWFGDNGLLLRDQDRDSDLELALTYGENLKANILMACDLSAQLEDIALAIRQSACCSGSGDVGTIESGGSTYFGNEAPLDAPTTFGGAGDEFATEAAYNAHRCEAANAIVDGFVVTLNNWALLNLSSLTVLGIVTGLAFAFLVAPPVAVFVALGFLGLTTAVFATLADYIDDNRQQLVCLLYQSESATEAYDAFFGAVEGLAVDAGLVEVEVGAVMAILERLGAIDAMNTLYEAVSLPPIGNAVACDTCGGTNCANMIYGSGDLVNGGTFTSEFVSTEHRLYFTLPANHTVTLSGLTGFTGISSSFDSFRYYEIDGACAVVTPAEYSSDTFSGGPYCIGHVRIFSSTAFTVHVSIGATCP